MTNHRRRLNRLETTAPLTPSTGWGWNGYGVCPFCGAPPYTVMRPPCEHAPRWFDAFEDHDSADDDALNAAVADALPEAGADYDPSMSSTVVSMEARREAARRGLSRAESWALVQSRLAERRARERAAAALDL